MAASKRASDGWELIIVDNAGNEETKASCEAVVTGSIKLKYVHESRLGVSAARNRAASEASCPWLLFLDDDVSFDNDFIYEMLEAINNHDEEIICPRMITPVQPEWPHWLRVRLKSGVGQFDLGGASIPLDSTTKIPVGACVCIRRIVYDQHGPFVEKLDRMGNKPFGGGETLLLWSAFKAGAKGIYLPHFTIRHEFISGKMTKAYWRRQGFYGGRSNVRMLQIRAPNKLSKFRLFSHAGKSLFKSAGRVIAMVVYPKESFENQYRAIAHFGNFYEAIVTLVRL